MLNPSAAATSAATKGIVTTSVAAGGATGTGAILVKAAAALAIVAGAVTGGNATWKAIHPPASVPVSMATHAVPVVATATPTEPLLVTVESLPTVANLPSHTPARASAPAKLVPPAAIEAPDQPAAPSLLAEESDAVRAARSALRGGDAARALRLLEDSERRFGTGSLAQEREALAIEALARTGDRDAVETRAAAFLRRYPSSPHEQAVKTFASR